MSDLDFFKNDFLPNIQSATVTYKKWRANFPQEASAWDAFVTKILAGQMPVAPAMTSKYGKALVAAGMMGMAEMLPPPPPPPPVTGPIDTLGTIRWGTSWGVTTYPAKYKMIGVSGGNESKANALNLPGTFFTYMTAAQASIYYFSGVDYQTALNNGWLLYKSDGVTTYPVAQGGNGVMCNPGNPGLQQHFYDKVTAFLNQYPTIDGFHLDNFEIDARNFGNGLTYPVYDKNKNIILASQADWEAAQISFAKNVLARFKADGRYVIVNGRAFISNDNRSNDGSLTKYWISEYAPYVSAMEAEYWLQDPTNIVDTTHERMALIGAEWWNNWQSWRTLVSHCQGLGIDFHGLIYGAASNAHRFRYGKGSLLLQWDGKSKSVVSWALLSNTSGDNWIPECGQRPGLPVAPEYMIGSCYARDYSGGDFKTVCVNPNATAQTVTIAGKTYTIPSADAIFV